MLLRLFALLLIALPGLAAAAEALARRAGHVFVTAGAVLGSARVATGRVVHAGARRGGGLVLGARGDQREERQQTDLRPHDFLRSIRVLQTSVHERSRIFARNRRLASGAPGARPTIERSTSKHYTLTSAEMCGCGS